MEIRTVMNTIASILKIVLRRLWQSQLTLSARWFVVVVVMTFFFLVSVQLSRAQIYVDACVAGPGDGSAGNPFKTLKSAVDAAKASPGINVIMKGGLYQETLTINNALTITAHTGFALVSPSGYGVGWRDVEVPLFISPSCSGTSVTNARVYYPSWATGPNKQIATSCGGKFPVVVYAHGLRRDEPLCSWSNPGPPSEDYKQAEGILTRLAASGIIAISVDWTGVFGNAGVSDRVIGHVVVSTIGYMKKKAEEQGSWLEGKVDMSHVGLSGHSTGGAGVIHAADYVRINGYCDEIDLTGVQIKGLGLIAPSYPAILNEGWENVGPTLVINGTKEHPRQVGLQPLEIFCELTRSKYLVYVYGANHFGYTDGICLDSDIGLESVKTWDPYGLDSRDFLPNDPGYDNGSEVGGVTGQEAHTLQQLAAGNYLLAFFSYYLQGNTSMLDYLSQQRGERCGYPGEPGHCLEDLMVYPPSDGVPVRYFDDLVSSNVVVNVCSCRK